MLEQWKRAVLRAEASDGRRNLAARREFNATRRALRGGATSWRAFNRRRTRALRGGAPYDYDRPLSAQGYFDDQTPEIGRAVAPPPTWAELRAKADAMPERSGEDVALVVGVLGIAAAAFAVTR